MLWLSCFVFLLKKPTCENTAFVHGAKHDVSVLYLYGVTSNIDITACKNCLLQCQLIANSN